MTATTAPPTRGGGGTIHHAVVATDEAPIIIGGRRAWFDRWWVPCMILPMMVASDFKWRRRAASQALGGSIDVQVLIELAVYGAVLLYIVYKYDRAPRWGRTDNLLFSMWAWTSIVFLSAFYSVYPKLGIVRAGQFVIVAILAQTIASRATIAHMHRLAHGYMILVAGSVALGYVWHGPLNHLVAGRFHWMYVHPVPAGVYVMCGMVIAAAYYKAAPLRDVLNFWPRWAYGAVCGWIGLALVLTKTRGSIAAGMVALAFVVLFHTPTRTKVSACALGLLSAAVAVLGVGPIILAYLERGNSAQQLATLNDRTNLWSVAISDYLRRPLTGYGLGASRGIFLDSVGLGGGHNAFVNVLVDQGGIGMAAFLAVIGVILWRLFRYPRGSVGYRESFLLVPLFVGLLVNSMTAEFMAVQANDAAIWLFAIIAWVTVISRAQRSADAAALEADVAAASPEPVIVAARSVTAATAS